MKDKLEQFNIPDPSTDDTVGVFTGSDYGWYFTEKFQLLVEKASLSELDALYVGAFIEELDMMDINQCPQVIVETDSCHKCKEDEKEKGPPLMPLPQ